MKKTFLSGAALLLLFPLVSFATSVKAVPVLIEHVDSIPKKHVSTKSAMCTASANPAQGAVDNNVVVAGYVSYNVTNESKITQTYWIDEYMCVNGFGCTHVRSSLILAPLASGYGGGYIYDKELISDRGTYVDEATIQVQGESTCFVQGQNQVIIN